MNRDYKITTNANKIKKKIRNISSEEQKEINKYVNIHSKRFKENLY